MRLKVLISGRWKIVSPMASDDASRIDVFLDGLAASFSANVADLVGMMELHSEHGAQEFNSRQVHYVDQDAKIFQYIKGRLRVFWFEDEGRVVVCMHGIVKKDQKTPKNDIAVALRCKAAYLLAKQRNELQFIEEDV